VRPVIPHGVEVFVGLDPIDLRWSFDHWSFDRLAGIVTERIGREARSGALFVFFGKRRDAMKVEAPGPGHVPAARGVRRREHRHRRARARRPARRDRRRVSEGAHADRAVPLTDGIGELQGRSR
jgi:hypothetical protein